LIPDLSLKEKLQREIDRFQNLLRDKLKELEMTA
jgi:hypothetical protein